MAIHTWDYAPEALEVNVSELLLATADKSDDLVDENVRQVLHDLRENLGMEVIFVSEIRNGNRMFQHVDTAPGKELIATGGGSSLEESFCQCVLDGTLPQLVHDAATHPAFPQLPATPFRVGAHLSAPIVLSNGKVYGTLCCFSQGANNSLTVRDLQKLECVAKLTAKRIDIKQARELQEQLSKWELQPLDEKHRPASSGTLHKR